MSRNIIKICFAVLSILAGLTSGKAKAQDSAKSPLVVTLSYFSIDNKVPYLTVNAKSKASGRFLPVPGVAITLYLNKDSTGKGIGLIGKVVTNEKGNASANIPASLSELWKASTTHTFLAVTDKSKQNDEASGEISIAKAKLTVDTAADKTVVATLSEYKESEWVPVKGVDIKIGIKRLGGDLPIGDEQTYTTDSNGHASGALKKLLLPGDEAGNIILVARVEDNDQYGNLRMEQSEPWGTKFVADNDFFHRTLWASQFHSPVWLVVVAYSIIIAVWGTLIYLVILLLKIRKLGREEESSH